jgi:hypothetical protein
MSRPLKIPQDVLERIRALPGASRSDGAGRRVTNQREVNLHRDRLGVRLTDDTDWEEIRDLIIESYRLLAPKKLIALLD